MSRRLAPSWTLVVTLLTLSAASTVVGQQSQLASRGPRFLLAAWVPGREVDASSAPVLRRRVSLDVTGVTVGEALKEVTRQAALEISYSPRVVPLDHVVSLHAHDITLAAALTEILLDVPVDVSVTADGVLALVRRSPPTAAPDPIDSGAVVGQVTDSASGSPIAGAVVTIGEARRTEVTDAGGRYRIDGLKAGTYIVRARYIGYRQTTVSVTFKSGEDVTMDFALAKSAQELDQVVVTGTIVPTEVKALPTPVTVIDERDIALQRPQTVQEVFRQAVPGAVVWDYSSSPYNTPFSVRGASSLTAGTPSMKVFVDGVDAAANGFSPVDPNSIARIEVIRGPQAASIYGSEAIGGVIQIFTKRGDPALDRPEVNAEVGLGLVQTPYAERGEVLKQEYKGSLRGGGSDVGYYLGGSYSHLGDWLPNGEISAQSSPSVYGGLTFARGVVDLDLSGRYYVQRGGNNLVNPALLQSGFAPFSKPSFQPMETQNQTVGTRLSVAPTNWWRTTVNAGIDRYSYDLVQDRPRFTTPADTLLFVSDHVETRTSAGISTSLQATMITGVSGSFTAGADYWRRPVSDWYALRAINTTGTITTETGGAISATRTVTSNTGYYAQTQIGYHDALFLTAGVRAERNTDFGDSLGTPFLPRVGLAYVRSLGQATVKLRGSWGRAIRAPSPGRKLGFVTAGSVQLANPRLGPERQEGWDAGIDVTIGRGHSLGITYYNQVAENLAEAVVLGVTPVLTQQYQNVGRVKNTGVEVEGTLTMGPVSLRGQYGYVHARIQQLSPTYAGDLQVGDEPLLSPRHTAGASVSVAPSARSTLSAGVVYVGSWMYYDNIALFRCFGGTGPCGASFRDYQTRYPGFAKVNVGVSHEFTPVLTGFLSIDNLTNNDAYEANNLLPVRGRTSTAGFRIQY
jgi:outer membrane receptor protein involved in Fe transport